MLEGHGGAVQCVLALPGGDLLTGSNDTTIKLWRGGACVHTLTGHTDTVRRVLLPHTSMPTAAKQKWCMKL